MSDEKYNPIIQYRGGSQLLASTATNMESICVGLPPKTPRKALNVKAAQMILIHSDGVDEEETIDDPGMSINEKLKRSRYF